MKDKIETLTDKENRKKIWNTKFSNKVAGRPATLGGVGDRALKIRLGKAKDYPNLDISGFLSWKDHEKFTEKEKQLVEDLLNQL